MSIRTDNMVSGAGLVTSFVINLINAVQRAGGSSEDIHSLADPEKSRAVWDQIARIIVGTGSGARQTFKVLVDYAKTLKEMIREGKYNWVDSNITQENFRTQEKGTQEIEIQLFHFGRVVGSEEVLEEMEREGFRPATLPELLALGAADRELQKEFPIVALGSRWRSPDGYLVVPFLHWFGLRRNLDLGWFESDWHESCRFAGVRK